MSASKGVMNYWTDEETGVLLDLINDKSLSTKQIAQLLGRSVTAIQNRRQQLRKGTANVKANAWTEDELDIVRSTLHLRAGEVAPMLIDRSAESVSAARRYLARAEGVTYLADATDPFRVGLRRLVAKSCLHCGVIMDAQWYRRNQKAGCWSSKCKSCSRERSEHEKASNRKRLKLARTKDMQRQSLERFQAATQPAANAGKEWTESDQRVLANPDLTVLEKALALKRTYKATLVALSRGGHTSKVGLGDPNEGRWIIHNERVESIFAA